MPLRTQRTHRSGEHMKIDSRRRGSEMRKIAMQKWLRSEQYTHMHLHTHTKRAIVGARGSHHTKHEYDSDHFIINYFYVSKFFSLRPTTALMFDMWPIRLVYLNACHALWFERGRHIRSFMRGWIFLAVVVAHIWNTRNAVDNRQTWRQ